MWTFTFLVLRSLYFFSRLKEFLRKSRNQKKKTILRNHLPAKPNALFQFHCFHYSFRANPTDRIINIHNTTENFKLRTDAHKTWIFWAIFIIVPLQAYSTSKALIYLNRNKKTIVYNLLIVKRLCKKEIAFLFYL